VVGEQETMTVEQGLGMLFMGVVALTIGGTIAFFILREVYRSLHDPKKKRFDDLE
tara:strand:+ start:530 stop:694 length:165 start_codon:yes stop_codon:yes gene_type:complete